MGTDYSILKHASHISLHSPAKLDNLASIDISSTCVPTDLLGSFSTPGTSCHIRRSNSSASSVSASSGRSDHSKLSLFSQISAATTALSDLGFLKPPFLLNATYDLHANSDLLAAMLDSLLVGLKGG